ncbi:MAG: hypothetical protein QM642_08355 [Edaphocola sp.]
MPDPYSIAAIKKQLGVCTAPELKALCLRMAKYKKENKELLAYLLFKADDQESYVSESKEAITQILEDIQPHTPFYYCKKTIRKALAATNKQIKYSDSKQAEAELLLHFCLQLKQRKLIWRGSTTLSNLYDRTVAKAKKAVAKLHDDLQYDYKSILDKI